MLIKYYKCDAGLSIVPCTMEDFEDLASYDHNHIEYERVVVPVTGYAYIKLTVINI